MARLADPYETEVKLPYYATIVVAIVSAIWSGGTAAAIRILDSKWAEAPLLGFAGFLVAWSCLGVVTLLSHSWRHDKLRAELEAMREATAAAQLRHKTKQQRARRAKTTEEETC